MEIFLNSSNLISTNKLPRWLPLSDQCSISKLCHPQNCQGSVLCKIAFAAYFLNHIFKNPTSSIELQKITRHNQST